MPTINDYVVAVQSVTFDQLPLNELDIVCLNELGYISFEALIASDDALSNPIQLSLALADNFDKSYQGNPFMMSKERLRLLELMLASERFESLTLSHYVNEISSEYEKQFAGMVFTIAAINYEQIVFRGTDDSLIGWKEDFKLTYSREISAHRSAISYLTSVLPLLSESVYLSGHSKGGNVAVYAASSLPDSLQSRLSQIYLLDAPGLHIDVLKSKGYCNIRDRLVFIRPQESIVGVMLALDVAPIIVQSAGFGISQHAVTNWQVNVSGSFVRVPAGTELSNSLEKTFKEWTAELGSQDLKLLFDTLFDTLIESGIYSLNDVTLDSLDQLGTAVRTFSHLPTRKRRLMTKAGVTFIGIFAASLKRPSFTRPNFPYAPFKRATGLETAPNLDK
ncbi:Mbeg1-like protein [Streptococcus saliviloxodontae]|uniref:DUF2974 domain-containing protein n=1 Tax=Streptococcus saliviloxodontae TaxID=1349416 RepID=A0ABS2PLX4_9STRE|nr:Mbeg1-like protein [Streptococcus saliviloxodontae]MBM7636091.1 hypothetical protein [Streptococcus saliviloxodontae]